MTQPTYRDYETDSAAVVISLMKLTNRTAFRPGACLRAAFRLIEGDVMDAYRNVVEFAELTTIGITPKKVARMKDARGMRLRVETGSVWITQDHCRDDVCLNAGDSHWITHNGLTVIAALHCPLALVSVEPSVPVARSMAQRFWNFWVTMYAQQSRAL